MRRNRPPRQRLAAVDDNNLGVNPQQLNVGADVFDGEERPRAVNIERRAREEENAGENRNQALRPRFANQDGNLGGNPNQR